MVRQARQKWIAVGPYTDVVQSYANNRTGSLIPDTRRYAVVVKPRFRQNGARQIQESCHFRRCQWR